ncbi:hypothetical protein BC940DRAFT_2114 [Gongronella butleri]|nr:hypothetical protein BC940DRAFT_2114 [Gongronella butleri]
MRPRQSAPTAAVSKLNSALATNKKTIMCLMAWTRLISACLASRCLWTRTIRPRRASSRCRCGNSSPLRTRSAKTHRNAKARAHCNRVSSTSPRPHPPFIATSQTTTRKISPPFRTPLNTHQSQKRHSTTSQLRQLICPASPAPFINMAIAQSLATRSSHGPISLRTMTRTCWTHWKSPRNSMIRKLPSSLFRFSPTSLWTRTFCLPSMMTTSLNSTRCPLRISPCPNSLI